jgi:hypothetical protein
LVRRGIADQYDEVYVEPAPDAGEACWDVFKDPAGEHRVTTVVEDVLDILADFSEPDVPVTVRNRATGELWRQD